MTNHASGHLTGRSRDDLLAAYVSGQLGPALHVLVAGHLALVPESRTFVQSLEAAHGAALEGASPVPVPSREDRLAAIFESDVRAAPAPEAPLSTGVLPAPLAHFIGTDLDQIRWRTVLPGVKEHKVGAHGDGEAALYRIKPGRRVLAHTHEGAEYTLVLKGSLTDAGVRYGRGDIVISDQDVDHAPRIDPGEDCICFVVTDAPLRLTGPVGRLVQRWFGPQRPWSIFR